MTFDYIINPETSRKVSIFSTKGRSILKNYLKVQSAGANEGEPRRRRRAPRKEKEHCGLSESGQCARSLEQSDECDSYTPGERCRFNEQEKKKRSSENSRKYYQEHKHEMKHRRKPRSEEQKQKARDSAKEKRQARSHSGDFACVAHTSATGRLTCRKDLKKNAKDDKEECAKHNGRCYRKSSTTLKKHRRSHHATLRPRESERGREVRELRDMKLRRAIATREAAAAARRHSRDGSVLSHHSEDDSSSHGGSRRYYY